MKRSRCCDQEIGETQRILHRKSHTVLRNFTDKSIQDGKTWRASPSASPILYCVTWRSHLCQTRFSQLQNEDTAPHPTIECGYWEGLREPLVFCTQMVSPQGWRASSTDLTPVCCFLGMTWMFGNCLQFLAFQQRPCGEAVLAQRNPFYCGLISALRWWWGALGVKKGFKYPSCDTAGLFLCSAWESSPVW